MAVCVVDIINECCTQSEGKKKDTWQEIFPEDRENIVKKKFSPREVLLNVCFLF